MLRVGLTGNIAGGKSSVARVWERLGAPVVSADALARDAVRPGEPSLRRVVAAFGGEVVGPDGALDRAALRARVFADDAARRRLESILHPEIERLRREAEVALEAAGARVVVHEIPLLYETGLDAAMDVVVLVDAPEPERLRRLVADRGIAEAEARRMIAAQAPAAAKRARADVVIDNDGDLTSLEREAERVWRDLERRAGASA